MRATAALSRALDCPERTRTLVASSPAPVGTASQNAHAATTPGHRSRRAVDVVLHQRQLDFIRLICRGSCFLRYAVPTAPGRRLCFALSLRLHPFPPPRSPRQIQVRQCSSSMSGGGSSSQILCQQQELLGPTPCPNFIQRSLRQCARGRRGGGSEGIVPPPIHPPPKGQMLYGRCAVTPMLCNPLSWLTTACKPEYCR